LGRPCNAAACLPVNSQKSFHNTEARRISHSRLRPNREGGGRSGAGIAHLASVRSLPGVDPHGYAARLVEVHMRSSGKALNTCLESYLLGHPTPVSHSDLALKWPLMQSVPQVSIRICVQKDMMPSSQDLLVDLAIVMIKE